VSLHRLIIMPHAPCPMPHAPCPMPFLNFQSSTFA
jgi:hypothetical protein